MPTRYDKEFKQNIINLYKQGESAAQLAREYGIGYSTVHKLIQGQAKTQSGGDHGPSIRRPRFWQLRSIEKFT